MVSLNGRGAKSAAQILMIEGLSPLNKQLINFFKKNLAGLNAAGWMFDWIVVYEDEIEFYEEQGISEFPMLVAGKERIAGALAIIRRLGSKAPRVMNNYGGRRGGDAEFDTHEYMMAHLEDKQDDEPDDERFKQNYAKKMMAMNKARQAAGLPGGPHTANPEIHEQAARSGAGRPPMEKKFGYTESNISHDYQMQEETPPSANTSILDLARKASGTGDEDDKLMLQFWENNEGMLD